MSTLEEDPTLTLDQAEVLTERIRSGLSTVWQDLVVAYQGRVWISTGYKSWDDYLKGEFGGAPLRLPREERADTVKSLRDAGLSLRAIASATGTSYGTVSRDSAGDPFGSPDAEPKMVTGADGKTYAANRPKPAIVAPPPVDDLPPRSWQEMTDKGQLLPANPLTVDEILDAPPGPIEPPITKPDLGGGISHPARYTDTLLPVLSDAVPVDEYPTVLDPFAGTGKIHALPNATTGVEIEPEWANLHPDTIVGNALDLPFDDATFDAIVTSPTYGNRLADSHNASDPDRRRSYTHDLGRTLADDNSGAMQWGPQYQQFHLAAWAEAIRVLRPGGRFVLNIKDHVRGGIVQHVTDWHVAALAGLGLVARYDDHWPARIGTPSLKAGANADARVYCEWVIVLDKPEES